MKRTVGIGLCCGVAGFLASTVAWAQTDMDKCVAWGASPGTQAYFNCLAALDAQRNGPAPAAQAPVKPPPNVADGLASQLCIERAKASPPYPIERLATNNVSGSDPKSVSLSFKIQKPGSALAFWNVTCIFREGRMVDFKAS